MEGIAFRLRPVTIGDAAFIVELRTDPELSQFLHPISRLTSDQVEWLKRYFDRPHDYYFIIERKKTGEAEGTIGIYDLDPQAKAAEWGRWILRRNSMAALESAILIYRTAFEVLDLNMLYCRTVAENRQVVSFHSSFGLEPHALLPGCFELGSQKFDAIEHRMERERWLERQPNLERKASRIAAALA
jgi:RimJ/RimL family protein N-acetyltransferase